MHTLQGRVKRDYQGHKIRSNIHAGYIRPMPGVALLPPLRARAGADISIYVTHTDVVHEAGTHRPQIHKERCYVEERRRRRSWLTDHKILHPACLGLYLCMRVRKKKDSVEREREKIIISARNNFISKTRM